MSALLRASGCEREWRRSEEAGSSHLQTSLMNNRTGLKRCRVLFHLLQLLLGEAQVILSFEILLVDRESWRLACSSTTCQGCSRRILIVDAGKNRSSSEAHGISELRVGASLRGRTCGLPRHIPLLTLSSIWPRSCLHSQLTYSSIRQLVQCNAWST